MALVSDAGMPGISDPGARLVGVALDAGVPVTVLPGPSAVETALVASGLVGERYQFLGFLPRRKSALAGVWRELHAWPHPAVAFESPGRLAATLGSLAVVEPDREVAVCRELTKVHEEIVRGSAADVASRFGEPPRGEITLVIGPGSEPTVDLVEAAEAVADLVGEGLSRRRAAEIVARLTGASRNELYRRTL
jgi:16S rRNA (cytidine1402-2'-O)-methyltransferase